MDHDRGWTSKRVGSRGGGEEPGQRPRRGPGRGSRTGTSNKTLVKGGQQVEQGMGPGGGTRTRGKSKWWLPIRVISKEVTSKGISRGNQQREPVRGDWVFGLRRPVNDVVQNGCCRCRAMTRPTNPDACCSTAMKGQTDGHTQSCSFVYSIKAAGMEGL